MTAPMGVARARAPTPASISVRRISSVAYATEESASEDSTARPVVFEGARGGPGATGSAGREESLEGPERGFFGHLFQSPTGLADGLGVGTPTRPTAWDAPP